MSLIQPKEGGKTASKPTDKKKRCERVEPSLHRYLQTGDFYTVLNIDGKIKYRSLQTTDKPTARLVVITRNPLFREGR